MQTFFLTDIEGSSVLWNRAPAEMRQSLARHDRILREAIATEGGQVFKAAGDAFFAAFSDATAALRAAVAGQLLLSKEPWPSNAFIRVRMALHTDEAERRDGDYFGQGLNRVARVLAAGHGQQILLTRATQEACAGRAPAQTYLRFLGEFSLRGLDSPEQIYQVDHDGLPHNFPALSASASDNHTASIAVLPFANVGNREEAEYFGDGLADELISVLGKIRDMRVASRTSAFSFKGKNADLAEVAKKLNVVNVLEGSVRQAHNRLRIAIKLIEVATETIRWSETYDRVMDDVFAIQDEIACSVVEQLRQALLQASGALSTRSQAGSDVAAASKGRTSNAEAHRLYLEARSIFVCASGIEDYRKAADLYKQALSIDPRFAVALADLSRAYAAMAGNGMMPAETGFFSARVAAEEALAIEPMLAEGYHALGNLASGYERNFALAESLLRKATELAPNHVSPHAELGTLLGDTLRPEEAEPFFRHAIILDPINPSILSRYAKFLLVNGRLEECEKQLRQVRLLSPNRVVLNFISGLLALEQNDPQRALEFFRRETMLHNALQGQCVAYFQMGMTVESDRALQALIDSIEKDGLTNHFQVAQCYAFRGDFDRAFRYLVLAVELRDWGVCEAMTAPQLRPLHGDARWLPFLRSAGFSA
jgi:TolB-like protein/class 3 adenylate cyclase